MLWNAYILYTSDLLSTLNFEKLSTLNWLHVILYIQVFLTLPSISICSLNLELFLYKWKILHSKNCLSHRSQPTDLHWEVFPLVVIPESGVKINIARRTGRCFPLYSPSSVKIFLFDRYKLTQPRVWQERNFTIIDILWAGGGGL